MLIAGIDVGTQEETSAVFSQDVYGDFSLFSPSCLEIVMRPRVSVLMAVRNGGQTLAESLQSVLRQRFTDFELLVADDGSTDETLALLLQYAAQDHRIRIVSQPNMGLAKSLNRLLGLAGGEYVARQDADDIWLDEKLARQVEFLDAHPDVSLLGTRYHVIDSAGEIHAPTALMSLSGDRALRDALVLYNPFMHASVLMRREQLVACGGYDDTYDVAQDYELWLRLRRVGRLEILPDVLCLRRDAVGRRITGKSRRQRRNVLRAKLRHGVISDFRHVLQALKDACAALLPSAQSLFTLCALFSYCIVNRRKNRGRQPCRVLFCSLRADWGGGPEHLFRLLTHTPYFVRAYLACPQDAEPYSAEYCKLVGAENCMHLPHRRTSLRAFLRLLVFIARHDIALLHSHGKGAGLYTRLASLVTGVPCVHTFHGVHIGGYSPISRYCYILLERCLGMLSFRNIAVSETEARMIRVLRFSPPERLVLIENGVEIPREPARLGSCPPYSVVHISRFDLQKNTGFILKVAKALDAVGRLGEFRFILIGDGEDRKELEKKVAECGYAGNIVFTGFTREPHVHFSGALCYFSCSRWEGLPLALLEAQAAGLPVVASRVCGNVDAVHDGETGLLFDLDSAEGAAGQLITLAADGDFASRLGNRAQSQVRERFDVGKMAFETFEVLRAACR